LGKERPGEKKVGQVAKKKKHTVFLRLEPAHVLGGKKDTPEFARIRYLVFLFVAEEKKRRKERKTGRSQKNRDDQVGERKTI